VSIKKISFDKEDVWNMDEMGVFSEPCLIVALGREGKCAREGHKVNK